MATGVSSCSFCNSAIVPKSHRINIPVYQVLSELFFFLWTLSAVSLKMKRGLEILMKISQPFIIPTFRQYVKARPGYLLLQEFLYDLLLCEGRPTACSMYCMLCCPSCDQGLFV